VRLFIKSEDGDIQHYLLQNYGLKTNLLDITASRALFKRGTEFYIAVKALFAYVRLGSREKLDVTVISRNIFAAIFFGFLFGKKIIYETHTPESGLVRTKLQEILLKRQNVETVVISDALKRIILKAYEIEHLAEKIHVMHDGAFDDDCITHPEKMAGRDEHFNGLSDKYKNFVGYFGHLYAGRGIEIIQGLAELHKTTVFLVFGGNEIDVQQYKINNTFQNLLFMGHVAPSEAKKIMSLMDVLLMPYQKSVSVGLKFVDTAQWMSPIKMFEYMSTGIPIISSNLTVLKEVLIDHHNCLLVDPEDIEKWSSSLNMLITNEVLANTLAKKAKSEFSVKYTWNIRAKNMLGILSVD